MTYQSVIAFEGGSRSRRHGVELSFGGLALCAIFAQKLGITTAAGGAIGFDAIILVMAVLWLFLSGLAVIDPARLLCFSALICSMAISFVGESMLGIEVKSLPAVGVLIMLYGMMVFRVDTDRETILRCFNVFQIAMGVIAVIVMAQQVMQFTIGNQYWPNLNNIIPGNLLLYGYAYLRPYAWNSPYLTPNGVFFLEPSVVSQYLAIALVIEIIWFKRVGRLALYSLGLIACLAGTGLTVIALVSPLLLRHVDRRLMKWIVGIGLPLLLIGAWAGAFNHILDRSTEFSSSNSSAYARMVVPFNDTMTLASDPSYLVTGNGPGTSPKGNDQVQWPANKIIYEYGILAAILFHVFLLLAVLGSSVSRTLTLVVLIPHLFFGGGFVDHTSIMALVLFGSLLRLKPDSAGTAELAMSGISEPDRRTIHRY